MRAPAETPITLALQRREAAAALGMSTDSFDRYVRPNVRVVYVGGIRLWPVDELRAWLERNTQDVPS